jgi:hypothetical protein
MCIDKVNKLTYVRGVINYHVLDLVPSKKKSTIHVETKNFEVVEALAFNCLSLSLKLCSECKIH